MKVGSSRAQKIRYSFLENTENQPNLGDVRVMVDFRSLKMLIGNLWKYVLLKTKSEMCSVVF